MENTKRCPIGLDGYMHYCPDDPGQHDSLEKIQAYLERKFSVLSTELQSDINREHRRTLEFIRNGCRNARLIETTVSRHETVPTITPEGQRALNDLKLYKAGVRGLGHIPQVTIEKHEPVKLLTFEEQIISDWKNDSSLQKEFTSFNAFAAYKRARSQGKTKIVGNRIMSHRN